MLSKRTDSPVDYLDVISTGGTPDEIYTPSWFVVLPIPMSQREFQDRLSSLDSPYTQQ